ncbi:MAG: ankyrin repeat domain-containing protein, partial [Candidatus Micrarchaeota archaeon]|nr:ankyrin repeat domain-containing protein [Candidatus Micrarchaeota archaeon]
MATQTKKATAGTCTAPSGIGKFKDAAEIAENATDTALHTRFGLAISGRNLDSATRCIADGADSNAIFDGIPGAINQGMWTMFAYACHHALPESENDARVVGAMLERCKSVEINAIDIEGKTPLMLALENSNNEVAGLILRYDADVKIKDKAGKTALVHAIKNCNGVSIIAAILEKGADANAADNCGRTPMMWASDPWCAAALMASGAEMNARDADGRSVLGHAVASLAFCKA